MTRLHAPRRDLLAEEREPMQGARYWLLRSPGPGWFRPSVEPAAWCGPGSVIGTLDVLGRAHALVVPPGVSGAIGNFVSVESLASSLSPHAVGYRDPIAVLTRATMVASDAAETAPAASAVRAADGLVFRAPTSGRFYSRAAPDKPPFVAAGATLSHGTTICLLEVMKTFHRVTYGGAGLPETARVVRVVVADGDDVNAGDPLLALE